MNESSQTSGRVGILTLQGFNEIDSFVAARMIDSVNGLSVELVGPSDRAESMAGIEVFTPGRLDETYDAMIVGSGSRTFEHLDNSELMAQVESSLTGAGLVGSQCSGAAILHRLGLVEGVSVCTDRSTAPRLQKLGVTIALESFRSEGMVATAGGCLSSAYLACWIIYRLTDWATATEALMRVVPVGEEDAYQDRATSLVRG